MSAENTNNSSHSTPLTNESRPTTTQGRASSYLHSLHTIDPSASGAADPDGLSPFSLPPLPAFQRPRAHPKDPKSPERHRRANSSLFYAAAWGSPYATPSPQQSPPSARSARKSLDSDRPSPSRFGGGLLRSLSSSGASVAQFLYGTGSSEPLATVKLQRRAKISPNPSSERQNWLSDSECSDIAGPGEEFVQTPTRDFLSNIRAGSFGKLLGHRSQESTATVTPYNFNEPPASAVKLKAVSTTKVSSIAAVGDMNERYLEMSGTSEKRKPLPRLPAKESSNENIDGSSRNQTSPSRPRLPSLQTFQRPKKQVLWKGKKCIIALPLQDRQEAGLPPLLSPSDVRERLRKWEIQGFDIDGFELGDSLDGEAFSGSGQSRPIFPDSEEILSERKNFSFQVRIPDQAEWNAWVDYIKEEKLRALGVTSSNSEPPLSSRSPFSGSASRASSHYTGLPVSPLDAPSSIASNAIRLGSNQFSPPFNPSTAASSHAGSISSASQYAGMPRGLHQAKQSIIQPLIQGRMKSPFDPMTQPFRSPPSYFARRQGSVSPAIMGGLPSVGEVLSPVSPFGMEDGLYSRHLNNQINHMQSQQQYLSGAPNGSTWADDLPITPVGLESRQDLEIAHPTPLSHRHNLSEALQKEIDSSETVVRDDELKSQDDKVGAAKSGLASEGRAFDEDEEEPPPILKRPEGMMDNDDRSDIITNPSNEPSPLPRDEHLQKWHQSQTLEALHSKSENIRSHKVQPSMSRLNVQAKEFDPRGGFASSNFSVDGGAFYPFGIYPAPPVSAYMANAMTPTSTKQPSFVVPNTRLNVEAPTFQPSFQNKSSPQAGAFNFSSATFNVKAPEFNPSANFKEGFKPGLSSVSEAPEGASNRIFGNVVINSSSKVMRRPNNPLSLAKPPSSTGSEDEDTDLDEDGRPQAPVDRQKRARRVDSDGDQSPVFAESAPFGHRKILSEILDNVEADIAGQEPSDLENIDSVTVAPVDGMEAEKVNDAKIDIREDPTSTVLQPSVQLHAERSTNSEVLGADSSSSAAVHRSELLPTDQMSPRPDRAFRQESSPKKERNTHQTQSSLATTIDLRSNPAEDAEKILPSAPKSEQADGSETLRYERSRSPSSPSSLLQRTSSPPSDLYSYIKPEDSSLLSETNQSVSNVNSSARPINETNQVSADRRRNLGASDGDDIRELDGNTIPVSTSTEREEEPIPSYEEIDAVMKQFEQNPDLGVERLLTPPIQPTPYMEIHLPPGFRSEAPSPSPRRIQPRQHYPSESKEVELGMSHAVHGLGIGVHKLTDGTEPVSDWNQTLSPTQESKLQGRAQFFDGHVNDLVGNLLETRLEPLEKALRSIQESITAFGTKQRGGQTLRSVSSEAKNSDADDEDEYDAFEGFADYRVRSPVSRKNRRADRIKVAVMEAMAAHQSLDHDNEEKLKLEISGLENMLKLAENRAEEEARSRRQIEDELKDVLRRLRYTEKEAAQFKQSSEDAEQSLAAYVNQRDSYEDLERTMVQLNRQNEELEKTLEEYRVSHDHWQDDMREGRAKVKHLELTLGNARDQLHERSQTCQALRITIGRLRDEMTSLVENIASERTEWRQSEHDLHSQLHKAEMVVAEELRRRDKIEQELENYEKEAKMDREARLHHEYCQQELSRLHELVNQLRGENKIHQDSAFKFEREVTHLQESTDSEVNKATSQLQAELDRVRAQLNSMTSDSEVQITRLQRQVDNVELDLEEQKAKHETVLAETIDSHNQALQEASEKREFALQGLHAQHEKKLNDLRERHTRALHNSSDDRHRLEYHLNEKLTLSDDKVQHLENKVHDLEERLEITKSAARAAVESATMKSGNRDLPTPAPSTVASPPHQPSLSLVKGSELPEKISPQALRESIMVLQDQLQNREQVVERLEAELAAVDKEAPRKVQERDTAITWLRELLAVRLDDIEDIIKTLSEPEFDRNTAKDAAIRLKANLQMEQQLKDHAGSPSASSILPLVTSLPSMASLSNLTQSPRAIPMAAAAAWGNWRKARDNSLGALSELANNLSSQTPSKSTMASPSSFLTSMMTPPSKDPQISPPGEPSLASGMRPLARSSSAGEARPLRAYNSQPRALSKRPENIRPLADYSQQRKGSTGRSEIPVTPPMRHLSAAAEQPDDESIKGLNLAFGEDVDEDASPLNAKDDMLGGPSSLSERSDWEAVGSAGDDEEQR